MKNKTSSKGLWQAVYFVFVLLLLFSEPVGPVCVLGRIAFDLFAIGNLINLVRILRKPSNLPGRVHQDAR